MGTLKMKQLIQSYVYWPGYSKDIDEYVRRCAACTVHSQPEKPPLTVVAANETQPWKKIAVDLTGGSHEVDGQTFLTVIDYATRFPEVYVLRRGSSFEIIKCLRRLFCTYGLPQYIVSDNGTAFVSGEFEQFLKSCGIGHLKSATYHPMGNSLVERFHRTLKSRIKRIRECSTVDLQVAIDVSLFDIRSSVNAMTGKTPFSALFGRPMSTKFSNIVGNLQHVEAPKRVPELEYKRNKRSIHKYVPGDLVFFRKGAGSKFRNEGVVLRGQNNTYELDTDDGLRKYNQCDIKPRYP